MRLRLTLFCYRPLSFSYENDDKRKLVSLKNNMIKEDGSTPVSFPLVTLKWTIFFFFGGGVGGEWGGVIVVRQ